MKMKQILENFRRYERQILKEELELEKTSEVPEEAPEEAPEEVPEETPTSGGALVDINAGPAEVLAAVKKLNDDPKLKTALKAGRTDAAGPSDEVIKIEHKPKAIAAKDLTPTQSQIGTGQSLNDQSMDEDFDNPGPTNLDRAIAGGMLKSRTGEFPILVFNNHILDGHHRWSQFMTTNPNAMVDIADITAPGIKSEKGALGLLHYMNYTLFGKSPTKDFKGKNIYDVKPDDIYDLALKPEVMVKTGEVDPETGKDIKKPARADLANTTVKKLYNAKLIAQPTKEAAAKHFADNLKALQAKGAGIYPRTVMPQPGDSGSPDGFATTPEEAAAGEINYRDPKPGDVKQT